MTKHEQISLFVWNEDQQNTYIIKKLLTLIFKFAKILKDPDYMDTYSE